MSYVIAGYTLVLGGLGVYALRLVQRTREVAAEVLRAEAGPTDPEAPVA